MEVLDKTRRLLQSAAPREAYLIWTGELMEGGCARIRAVVAFTGPADDCSAEPSPEDLARLREHLRGTKEFVFAQIHSHAQEAFHSLMDSVNAFSFKRGFLSVVVPHYGIVKMKDLSECAVYELDGGWRLWGAEEVAERVVVTGT